MLRNVGAWLLVGWMLIATAAVGGEPPRRPMVLVHVMPWFEAKPTSRAWGWHWTMGRRDPEKIGADGRREIAAHVAPLIGPYDSTDPDVLEYQTLLMKVAGVDGAIVDWYGAADVNDYPAIHRRTGLLFDALRARGLKFALCYEDRTIKAQVDRGKIATDGAVERARLDLDAAGAWFKDPAYVDWKGRPLLLVFGPDYLRAEQWEAAFRGRSPAPIFLTLHERKAPAQGKFAWPPMWASKDGVLDAKALDAYLDRFARPDGLTIPCAFPGFHDYYREAGVGPSHGYLDPDNGATFRRTLDRALKAGAPFVQIATWNDYGEGTVIEPTVEEGYRYVTALQQAVRKLDGRAFRYRETDLETPGRMFQLRKASAPAKALDEAAALVLAGEGGRAAALLDAIEHSAPRLKPEEPARVRTPRDD